MNQERKPNTRFGDVPAELGGAQHERLRVLFPRTSDAELGEIVETLNGYCAIAWRIYERLKRERPEIIDELMRSRTMKVKVDSSKETKTT